ncbi:MAG: hypothetical protein Q7J13_13265 [Brevundimonas sp.]|uniref:hypothetical protein n=1 Tax=Brevundimonas sp. TaxID=1871086 RepID=UPI00271B8D68|nr:hypothetical protein [Brevundimonas sp.]MDO9588889.1 hypothetical protein [Brevundimonas sp.]
MRALAVLTFVSLTLAGGGPAVSQAPNMDQALRRARDVTPLPLTLARARAEWLESQADLPDGLDAADEIQSRIEALLIQAERDERMGGTILGGPPDLGRDCVVTGLQGCSSSIGGYLALGESRLLWQVQDGFTDEDGVSGGIVFIGDGGPARMGPTAPIAWSFDGAWFEAPVLLSGPGFGAAAYIAVPGIRAGSGSGNADVLFRWDLTDTRRLTQIDTWSWRDSLANGLPEGLEIWQGVRFDWPDMRAFTPLWQDGDGHCCGTGGTAVLSFEIDGDQLVLSDISVRDAVIDNAISTPTEVFDYAARWAGCAHWGGAEAEIRRRPAAAGADRPGRRRRGSGCPLRP